MIQEIRQIRIPVGKKSVAVLDVGLTVGGAYYVAKYKGWNVGLTIVGFFVLGHAAHKIVGVRTQFS